MGAVHRPTVNVDLEDSTQRILTVPHDIRRVPAPDWAERAALDLEDMQPWDHERLQARYRDDILAAVDRAIEAYLRDPDLTYETDHFPTWQRLTGEYYIAGESYWSEQGPPKLQMSLMAHCLESAPPDSGGRCRDYLGLEVWLELDELNGAIEVVRSTDSCSI